VERMLQEHALSVSTLKRYESAQSGEAVAMQELDERRVKVKTAEAALKEAQTNVKVAEAALKRLSELRGFEKITAPFAGVITARGFDAGALISAGDAGGGKELFRIEDTQTLRVQVNVPQSYATDVRIGQAAQVSVRNFPGRVFAGAIARSAGAVDAGTRTLRVEVDVPNAEGVLLPGMYGQVGLECHRDVTPLMVPASTLLIGADGVRIAVVEGTKVRVREVTVGRDLGAEIEVLTGLAATDAVVNNPAGLADGAEVSVRKRAAPGK